MGEKRLCSGCVGEAHLKSVLESAGTVRACSYCGASGKTLSIGDVARHVNIAISNHYQRVYAGGPWGDEEVWDDRGELISEVIADEAGVDEDVAEDIRESLSNGKCLEDCADPDDGTGFETKVRYEKAEPNAAVFHNMWIGFENSIKSEARFLTRKSTATLDRIFKGIKDHKTSSGKAVVVDAGPEGLISELYRARVFQSGDKLAAALKRPDIEMGPPPASGVRAGRMNAFGISVFYASRDVDTAIAEVRPPVGSRVAVAKFKVVRPLRLLDVSALRSIEKSGSIFNPEYLNQLQQANFLRTLSARISRPVMPDDEALEYLATQAIANYLAEEMELDGLVYPSMQIESSKGNVVLFHRAAHVKLISLLEGTNLDVSFSMPGTDDDEPDYHVWEEVPPGATRPSPDIKEVGKPPALEVDLSNIQVHHIKHVKFSLESYPVSRNYVERIPHETRVTDEF